MDGGDAQIGGADLPDLWGSQPEHVDPPVRGGEPGKVEKKRGANKVNTILLDVFFSIS